MLRFRLKIQQRNSTRQTQYGVKQCFIEAVETAYHNIWEKISLYKLTKVILYKTEKTTSNNMNCMDISHTRTCFTTINFLGASQKSKRSINVMSNTNTLIMIQFRGQGCSPKSTGLKLPTKDRRMTGGDWWIPNGLRI